MSYLYHHFIVDPMYNALVALFAYLPFADAGLAIIIITVLVRLILFPLSKKAVTAQVEMQNIAPELERIKDKYKDNQEEQARKTLALYKEKGVNPFSGILVLIIQLPVVFALYHIFLSTGFPKIDASLLYSFVHAPDSVSPVFLGIDLTQKSLILAALAAIATFIQMKLVAPPNKTNSGNKSFGDDLARNMQTQMKYFLPFLVFFIAYKISGVIALYWLVTNVFTIGQEIVVRKRLRAQS
ncbi:YidC/Oxa1 family membrane protein insertase [Candidatus Parcubacteria bacterium]|nr:YidC/Oxa1 family membrane protein insertase [Candidatus Parcubacteria bacterium]